MPLAVAIACLAGRVEAQTQTQSQGPIGDPIGENITELHATDITVYDTDVSRSDAEIAHLRGLQQADVNTTPTLNVNLLRAIGEQSVFLRGSAGYDFYARNTVLDTDQVDMTGGADLRAGACQGVLSDQLTRHQNSLEQDIVAVKNNVLSVDTASLSADCTRTIGFTPTGTVSAAWSNDSNPQERSLEYQTITSRLGVAYQRPSLGRVSLFGQYVDTDYVNQPLPNDPSRRNGFKLYAAGVHYERNVGVKLNGSIDVSYTSMSENLPGQQGFSGLNFAVLLNSQITGRLGASIQASRSTTPTLQLSSNYSVVDDYSVELDYALSERLRFAVGATEKHHSYPPDVSSTADVLTRQATTDVFARGTLDFADRFSLVLNVLHEDTNTNLPGFDYSSMRVALTLTGRL
jgi:hypothetical protein